MKLKNKISGEIKEFVLFDGNELQGGVTLKNLAQEWEDAPEDPKDFWYIKPDGCRERDNLGAIECDIPKEYYDKMKQIGNYFETKEEAEKAVEKLKAWKRLKDKGLHVTTFYVEDGSLVIRAKAHNSSGAENWEDLDLLFSGERNNDH